MSRLSRIERLLAGLLSYGTWISSALILIGLAAAMVPGLTATPVAPMRVVNGGIALLILLPILRVIFMLIAFLKERAYRLSLTAGIVLAMIILGFVLGTKTSANG